jgi:glycosyltransferase involved in cell wall biosynthesis
MGLKILFLVPYPLRESPSQRFRFEQYFPLLQKSGIQVMSRSFLDIGNAAVLTTPGNNMRKVTILAWGFLKRFIDVLRAPFYDIVFIHREASPIGPPVFEWILRFIFHRKIVYDFDDAIWLSDKQDEPGLVRFSRWRGKVRLICGWASSVSCANDYLCAYASQFSTRVILLPTTIDTDHVHNRDLHAYQKDQSRITIGWTGSHSTLKYLKLLEPTLIDVEREHPHVTFLVIADRKPPLSLPAWDFIRWNPDTEARDLLRIDIGIMPLPDDDWTKGKSGLKCLQYFALEIPAVASRVGVNSKIIEHGKNGFLATTPQEWKQHLVTLIKNKDLRARLGAEGRKTVVEGYSIAANAETFLSLFKIQQ